MLISSRLLYGTAFYILVVSLLVSVKPSLIFERTGKPKAFGIGRNKTLFAFGGVSAMLASICFFIFAWIDIVFGA